jgi:hypothetical protein
MIVTKEAIIGINSKNIHHFRKLGYQDLKIKNKITIPVEQLMVGSKYIITAKCDICGNEKEITYKLYNYCISKFDIYTCNGKCSNIKRQKNSLSKYGVDHWMKSPDNFQLYKKSIIEKTGFDNIFKNPESKEKFRRTLMAKYGFSELSHIEEIYKKQQISGFSMKKHECGLYYRGSYELDFINYSINNNIKLSQGLRFSYNYNGKNKYYFSDFFIEERNLIIEIKSDYYWKKYLETNLLKIESVKKENKKFLLILNKNYHEFNEIMNLKSV